MLFMDGKPFRANLWGIVLHEMTIDYIMQSEWEFHKYIF